MLHCLGARTGEIAGRGRRGNEEEEEEEEEALWFKLVRLPRWGPGGREEGRERGVKGRIEEAYYPMRQIWASAAGNNTGDPPRPCQPRRPDGATHLTVLFAAPSTWCPAGMKYRHTRRRRRKKEKKRGSGRGGGGT